jgi:hypothetical protein
MSSKDPKLAPAVRASTMQLRTRKAHRFDEIESSLPIPLLPNVQTSFLSASGLLSHLGSRNPFAKPVTDEDVVWLFDNTAFKPSRFGSWQAEFVTAVFEQEPKCAVVDIVATVARIIGLADNSAEMKTIEERLIPFLWDIRPGRHTRAITQKKEVKLGPTGPNGVSSDILKIPDAESGTLVKTSASVPSGTKGTLQMQTFYADPDGWAVVSGISSTAPRESNGTNQPSQILTIPSRSHRRAVPLEF